MNLWMLFPESILNIRGILYLPYLAVMFYGFVLLIFINFSWARTRLLLFLFITLTTSVVIVMTIGPGMGTVLIPLLLLLVMLMPLVWLIPRCRQKNKKEIFVWSIVTLAGWLHSFSWVVWVFALARS